MRKGIILCSTFCVLLLAFGHNAGATSMTIGDLNELGFVQFGIPTGDSYRTTYVNAMIGLSLGGSTIVTFGPHSNTVTRSTNIFSPLDPAVFNSNGTGTTVNLGTGGFEYLFAKYDGPRYGAEVWYVGGLTGTITIPALGGKYGLSGWTLFTPGDDHQVPDGGSTVALLGLSLTGLAGIRAKFQRP